MRFHVISLPHTQVTRDYSCCAYTEKVRKFCRMMKARGHAVFLYAGEQSEAPCDEMIPCITEAERAEAVGDAHYTAASFDWSLPHWRRFNQVAAREIRKRAEPHDFVCVIAGIAHKPIADALPDLMIVEFGIGYGGVFANYRVFESYAWMHTCYGTGARDAHALDGRWYDAVIPNYFEPEAFPFRAEKGDYYLFIGRMIERKGVNIAAEVCESLGARLVLAGIGTPPRYGEHVGVVGPEQRGELMAGAKAVFVPTQYIEPFGGVAVEAMLCGTPVITTDWGAFTETVKHGETGFRCRTFAEFRQAALDAETLSPFVIHKHAMQYSLDAIAPRYEAYFERLTALWGKGWYEAA